MQFFNRSKPKQELMTLLEPRRLMSLTGGIDYRPSPDTAPTQITHAFGFEHALTDGDTRQSMPMNADFGQPASGFNFIGVQFARAIAPGSPVFFADSSAANPMDSGDAPVHMTHAKEFTSMYTDLSNSTVMSIDAATITTATNATLSAVNDTTFHASVTNALSTPVVATASVTNQNLTTAVTTAATDTAGNSIAGISTIASAVTLPAPILIGQSNSISPDSGALPPHITLQTVEQELLTVSTLANEMISQLGRDIAIELSHLEANLSFDSIEGQFSAHWEGWRSAAAATGAAIATIVYLQNETDREKPKTDPTFSSRLIEVVPN